MSASRSLQRSKDHAVSTIRLSRTFERRGKLRTALTDFEFEVARGEVHGLLGPNGAGKTTLCRILSTILLPSAGRAEVVGLDVVSQAHLVRSAIGVVFGGDRGLYGRLTPRQNLRYWAAMYRQPPARGRQKAEQLLERVGLLDRADEPVERFSRGMKQRLHLARGLIGDPQVLILDEPTTGLDPAAAHDFRDLIRDLRAERRTVLLTTHDMQEAEAICDRVSLIDGGRLLATAATGDLGRWMSEFEVVKIRRLDLALLPSLRAIDGVSDVVVEPDGTVQVQTSAQAAAGRVVRMLLDAEITTFSCGPPSLEAVYLFMVGRRGLQL